MRKIDACDVYSYKDAESFADGKYEELYDYEDDYDDEDEACVICTPAGLMVQFVL